MTTPLRTPDTLPSISTRPTPPRTDRRWWAVALLMALVVVAGALLLLLSGDPASDDPGSVPTVQTPPPDGESSPAPGSSEEPEPEADRIRYLQEPPANWDVTGVRPDDVLNVRTGPGADYPITTALAPDTVELESTGRIAHVGTQLWREIKVPGATTGWVNARHLTEHRPDPALAGVGVGLPAPAMTTAQEIYTFAQRGDLDSLARLAVAGDTTFTASFGDDVTTPEELVALWQHIGRGEVLDTLTALVALPDWHETSSHDASGGQVSIHVTPGFMHEPTAANRTALEQQLGRDAVDAGIADGQWLGWRLGITSDGDWQFFVTGD